MEFLRTELEKHNKLYYENDAPIISDFEYDAMLRELEELETMRHRILRRSMSEDV